MSDLISRSELKKALSKYAGFTEKIYLNEFIKEIDNAPSVYDNPYSDGREDGYIEGYEKARPQGEWIDVVNSGYPSVWHYECSECHGRPLCTPFTKEDFLSKFCPNCGAKMKGGAE